MPGYVDKLSVKISSLSLAHLVIKSYGRPSAHFSVSTNICGAHFRLQLGLGPSKKKSMETEAQIITGPHMNHGQQVFII